jgi:hypothetical protein
MAVRVSEKESMKHTTIPFLISLKDTYDISIDDKNGQGQSPIITAPVPTISTASHLKFQPTRKLINYFSPRFRSSETTTLRLSKAGHNLSVLILCLETFKARSGN